MEWLPFITMQVRIVVNYVFSYVSRLIMSLVLQKPQIHQSFSLQKLYAICYLDCMYPFNLYLATYTDIELLMK